jgi:uncharacterized protein
LKARFVPFIVILQSFLLVAHWFLYRTVVAFFTGIDARSRIVLAIALFLLAISFVTASVLSFQSSNALVGMFYRVASVWMGFLNFLFFAGWLCWLIWWAILLAGWKASALPYRPLIGVICLGAAVATGVYGLINARLVRVRRLRVKLANLPPAWHGRSALVASDLHLGHVNGTGFSRHMVATANQLKPDVVFIAGDFFDGSKVDAHAAAAPFQKLAAPLGVYFSTGNHDEFGDPRSFLEGIAASGIRVLASEKVVVDGLQVLGLHYHDTTNPTRFKTVLDGLKIDRGTASVLISHVPSHLPIAEQAGIGLQVSGHTHGGQFLPFTWITNRIFGKFVHGLNAHGSMQVYTSYGAGTWGPPMRVGTTPEMVLLTFE